MGKKAVFMTEDIKHIESNYKSIINDMIKKGLILEITGLFDNKITKQFTPLKALSYIDFMVVRTLNYYYIKE